MPRMQPTLVTGAAGLIGRRVIELLAAAGRPALATDRELISDTATEIVRADIRDAAAIDALVGQGVDGIVHCGAISGPMLGQADPAGTIAINVQGTLNVLESARLRKVRRLVHCSSVAAYGATPAGLSPVPPSAPLSALGIYGASKAAADILVRAYASEHGLDAVALRIGWVYGPRRRTRSLLGRLIRDALEGRASRVEHDGQHRIPLIHVDDVARGLIAALDTPRLAARALNLTDSRSYSMRELAEAVRRQLPSPDIAFTPGIPYPDVTQEPFEIASTTAAIGWSPAVSLDEGVAGYIDWLKANPF